MRDELLAYYERELRFIRKLAGGFAEKYPEVAGRLLLEPTKCEDPHVERLIEAFAMLTARVHLRLDDDFSEVSDALLGLLYPHYLRPIPSLTIAQLSVDADVGNVPGGFQVARHSLLHSRPVDGVRCSFLTAYDLRLFPLAVEEVDLVDASAVDATLPAAARSALRLRLRTAAQIPVAELALDRLRLFLDAPAGESHALYELLLRDPQGLVVRAPGEAGSVLGAEHVQPVGFGRDEGLLEYPSESFVGYRLLQEYFAFQDKFLFVELGGLEAGSRGAGDALELLVLLPDSVASLDLRPRPEHFKLGCTPAVNLFPHAADPIRLTQASVDYRVEPDVRAPLSYEVYAVTEVTSTAPGSAETRAYRPFYAQRHGAAAEGADPAAFWTTSRRQSLRKGDVGSDVYVSLVDEAFHAAEAPADVLHVETLCTNRALPSRLPFGDPDGDFQLEGRPGVSRIRALRKPTEPQPAPAAGGSRWRLVSHLALNHLSLTGEAGGEGSALEALREILRLYDPSDSPITRQRIAGLVGVRTRPVVRRVAGAGFARGIEVELELDPTQFAGRGAFLFAAVLDRFLGLYSSLNSFTQVVAVERQRPGVLKRWPPRAGQTPLV